MGDRQRSWARAFVVAGAVGLALGVSNSMASALGTPYGGHALRPGEGVAVLEVVAACLGTLWAWALAGFAMGWLARARRWWIAAPAGVVGLALAVGSYYLSDWLLGTNDRFAMNDFLIWLGPAVVAGLIFGSLGHWARSGSPWSTAAALAAPAVIVLLAGPSGPDHVQPWPRVVAWALVALLLVAIGLRWSGVAGARGRARS